MAQRQRPEHVGDHYQKVAIDTWDFIDANFHPIMRYGFYCGNVIKYSQRAHLKNGGEDQKKASHYQDKLDGLMKEFPNLLESFKAVQHLIGNVIINNGDCSLPLSAASVCAICYDPMCENPNGKH